MREEVEKKLTEGQKFMGIPTETTALERTDRLMDVCGLTKGKHRNYILNEIANAVGQERRECSKVARGMETERDKAKDKIGGDTAFEIAIRIRGRERHRGYEYG